MKKIILLMFFACLFIMCDNDSLFIADDEIQAVSIESYFCDTNYTSFITADDFEGHIYKSVTIKRGESVKLISFVTGDTSHLDIKWEMGDGKAILDSLFVSHTYNTIGIFKAIFSVSDSEGFKISDTVVINVEAISGAAISGYAYYHGKKTHDSISVKFIQSGIVKYVFKTDVKGRYGQPEHFVAGIYDILFEPLKFTSYPVNNTLKSIQINDGLINTIDTVILEDNIKPHIVNCTPLATISMRTIEISADFLDTCSGISPSTFLLTFNEQQVTDSLYTIDATGFSWIPNYRLLDGIHKIEATIQDSAGNIKNANWQFTVDAMKLSTMSDTVVKINSQLTFTGSVSDVYSSVVEYRWDYNGDNVWDDTIISNSNNVSSSHIYTSQNYYKAILYVRDDYGTEKYDTLNIEVRNNNPKILSINPDTLISINDSVKFYVAAIDSDGVITKCEWDLDGDGIYEIYADSLFGFTQGYSDSGIIKASVKITDDDNKFTVKSINIEVIQDTPECFIKAAQSVAVNTPITFNDSVFQKIGTIVMYKWNDGKTVGWNDSSSTLNSVTYTYEEKGNYIIGHYVRDDDGNFDTVIHNIEVTNDDPTIISGISDTTISIYDEISYTVVAKDINGIKKYCWDFGDGSKDTTNVNSTKYSYRDLVGEYRVIVSIIDNFDGVSTDTAIVNIVQDIPQSFIKAENNASINTSVVFYDSVFQEFGNIIMYKWDDGKKLGWDDSSSTMDSIIYKFYETGDYTIRHYVRDDDGNVDTTSFKIEIINGNPIINIPMEDTIVSINDTVKLKVSASDVNGIMKYYWDFGDGNRDTTTINSTEYVYKNLKNTYYATVTVIDSFNAFTIDTAKITVVEDSPIIDLCDGYTLSVDDSIKVTGTIKNDFGSIVSMEWSLAGQPFQATIPQKIVDTLFFAPSDTGFYSYILKVVDDDGLIDYDTVNVEVVVDPPTVSGSTITPVVSINDTVILKNEVSDVYGTIKKWEWKIDNEDWNEVSGNDTIITVPSTAGFVVCSLRVTDDDGNVSTDTVKITVKQYLPYPYAGEYDVIAAGDSVKLQGIALDTCGFITKWEWKIEDDGWIEVANGYYSFIAPLVDSFMICSLRVTDDDNHQVKTAAFIRISQFLFENESQSTNIKGIVDGECVVFNNKMWVIGGAVSYSGLSDNIYSSEDGKNWTLENNNAPFQGRRGHSTCVYDNKIWLIGGIGSESNSLNDVWYSTDGINWMQTVDNATFKGRWGHTSVVYKNKIWIIGGFKEEVGHPDSTLSDIWCSEDGYNWNLVTENAIGPRGGHSCFAFNDSLWILAGSTENSHYGARATIYCSEDGISWYNVGQDFAPFEKRWGQTTLIHNNKIWMIGGEHRYLSTMTDVWSSENGRDWEQATSIGGFKGRSFHNSVIYDSKIWIMFGTNDGRWDGKIDDVWSKDLSSY